MAFTKALRTALTGLAILATGTLAAGAQDFPKKDITHIMPWSAGGGTDTVMRTFLHYAEEPLGVGIRTQNVTGAQSGVGTLRLMKSRPDGYTIGSLTWDSMITVPYKNLVPGYDTASLSYLANVTLYPTVLAVNADTGWDTLDDFIAAAKAAPGEVTVSDSGIGGIWHLHALDMAEQLGVELNHVPFPNGSAEQREALILVGASGFSYEEAAGMCGVAVGTIKSRANRGRARLAELLQLGENEPMELTDQATMAVVSGSGPVSK